MTALAVTKDYLAEQAARARGALARMRQEQAQSISDAKRVVEVGLSSFAIGYLHGRKGAMPTIAGVPYDALGGGIMVGLALVGGAGEYRDDALNVGVGLLGYYAGNLGAQLGQKMRKDSPDWKGVALSEDEGKKLHLQPRTIVAGGMPRGFAPAHSGVTLGY